MKKIALAIVTALFVLPLAFPKVVAGCRDSKYVFRTFEGTPKQVEAAKVAKGEFCRVAAFRG